VLPVEHKRDSRTGVTPKGVKQQASAPLVTTSQRALRSLSHKHVYTVAGIIGMRADLTGLSAYRMVAAGLRRVSWLAR
jgi:hypothetical protein